MKKLLQLACGSSLFALLFLPKLSAQIDQDASTELFRPFRASLVESRKLESNPILPEIDTSKGENIEYFVPTRLLSLDYPPPVIRPQAMPRDNSRDGSSFFLKAGIGYPLSPLFDMSYYNKEVQNLSYGLELNHFSGRGANIENQRFGQSRAKAQAKYQTSSALAIGGELAARFDAYRFYAEPSERSLPADSAKQLFSEFSARIYALNGRSTPLDINYKGLLDFYALSDSYGASEIALAPQLEVEKWFSGKHRLALETGLFYTSMSDSSLTNDSLNGQRNLIWAKPYFEYNSQRFKGHAGVNIGSSEGNFFVFPELEAALTLGKGEFSVYAGWSGQVHTNTFRSLSLYNPFIISTPELRHSRQQDIYGGVRGQIKKLRYDGRLGLSLVQNLAIFQNDSFSGYRRFALSYDTARIFFIQGSLEWQILQELSIHGRIASYAYSLNQSAEAYHLPVLESNFGATYRRKALELKAELYFNAGVAYFDELRGVNDRLGPLLDLNLAASYYFSSKVGAFVALNNIFNNQNQRWHYYPQIGFNAMLGVLVKF